MVDFAIRAEGPPQLKGTRWYATERQSGMQFPVGYTVSFKDGDGSHLGLAQYKIVAQLPDCRYDRFAATAQLGLWAHFIWPSVVAEGGGHHLSVNTYDRARFTFGFYQLAAHTPGDNLILLFRALLALPSASDYFPDLRLVGGKVHRVVDGVDKSLETVTSVTRPNGKIEDQIVGFMTYLNPDTRSAGETEALNAAKLMHWIYSDPAALAASVTVAVGIMKRKLRSLAQTYDLTGQRPELAIWVSDITHQGRGSKIAVRQALAAQDFQQKLDLLYEIGAGNKDYDGRRRTVREKIATLMAEGRFDAERLGQGALSL